MFLVLYCIVVSSLFSVMWYYYVYLIITRGNRTPGSRVATACSSTIAHRSCNTFQITHMPREDHERSRRSIELSQQWRPKEIEKNTALTTSPAR